MTTRVGLVVLVALLLSGRGWAQETTPAPGSEKPTAYVRMYVLVEIQGVLDTSDEGPVVTTLERTLPRGKTRFVETETTWLIKDGAMKVSSETIKKLKGKAVRVTGRARLVWKAVPLFDSTIRGVELERVVEAQALGPAQPTLRE
jgi:hypothetical protein